MRKFINRRILNTIKYSLSGIKATWKTEQAFRIEIYLSIIGFLFIIFSQNINNLEKSLLTSSIFLVLIVELINTGLEKTIDKISMQQHPISKIVKDAGSGAVFIAVINLLFTWGIILL